MLAIESDSKEERRLLEAALMIETFLSTSVGIMDFIYFFDTSAESIDPAKL